MSARAVQQTLFGPRRGAEVAARQVDDGRSIVFEWPMRVRNPLNGQAGNSRLAALIRTRERARHRTAARLTAGAALQGRGSVLPCIVTLTRVAPSRGLDDDGLAASLKGVRDGVADALGLRDDRSPLVVWRYEQSRGRRGEYAVCVRIDPTAGGQIDGETDGETER